MIKCQSIQIAVKIFIKVKSVAQTKGNLQYTKHIYVYFGKKIQRYERKKWNEGKCDRTM